MNIKKSKAVYCDNKQKKVGESCVCPSCGAMYIKSNYQQAFCKTKAGTMCKDKYWNNVTPNKRNNTTRISPANARYYNNVICVEREYYNDFDDDQGWDAHKD